MGLAGAIEGMCSLKAAASLSIVPVTIDDKTVRPACAAFVTRILRAPSAGVKFPAAQRPAAIALPHRARVRHLLQSHADCYPIERSLVSPYREEPMMRKELV